MRKTRFKRMPSSNLKGCNEIPGQRFIASAEVTDRDSGEPRSENVLFKETLHKSQPRALLG
jgi:hypothetical protein